MSRTTLLHRVECMEHSYYEIIAAFNVDRAAMHYAEKCVETNGHRGLQYRVMTLKGNKWKQVWPVS